MKTNPTSKSPVISVMDRPLRVLHVEDSPDDRRLIQAWMQDQNIAAEFTSVDNKAEYIRAFKHEKFDIILCDKSLPGFDGHEALRYARENYPQIPFVFVTGSMGEEAAIETIKEGATDYVLKDRLSRLIPAVERAVRETEHTELTRRIEEKNRQQAALLNEAQDAIYVTDAEDNIEFWNKSAERIYGWPAEQAVGHKAMGMLCRDPIKCQEATKALLRRGNWVGEMVTVNHSGRELIVESRWTLVRDDEGNPKSVLVIDTDVTEKKGLEVKFLRSQRMDCIGALAGGIAHDLNNALAPVLLSTEFLRMVEDKGEQHKFLDIIQSNARRATDLVQQVLSFARGSRNPRGPVLLLDLVQDMAKLIQETFPRTVQFALRLPDDPLWTIHGDSTEIHQVLLNLCVNARDAMPEEGRLTISIENVNLSKDAALAHDAAPGAYVAISVTDTGTGIPAHVLPHIFQPFFTTKNTEGVGLGLATVAEILKRHRGFLDIHTRDKAGTEFKVFFPAIVSAEVSREAPASPDLPSGRGETILLIDNETSWLELTKTMLENFGYRVVTAKTAPDAISQFKAKQADIRMIVTDTDRPHLDGLGAVRAIKELRPDLPVIISGAPVEDQKGLAEADPKRMKNLGKSYSADQLLIAVDMGLHR